MRTIDEAAIVGRRGLNALLPATVVVEHATADSPDTVLFPEERAHIAGAVPKRVAEFATVRECARRALTRLGRPATAILPGVGREPVWPEGVVGSLTHCEGLRVAAVAHAAEFAALGIDAETHEPLPEGTADLITIGGEPRMLRDLSSHDPGIAWDRVLFSAKESVYKTWYPITGRWLDFTECEFDLRIDGTFTGQLLVEGPFVSNTMVRGFSGRWVVVGPHVLTATWVARRR